MFDAEYFRSGLPKHIEAAGHEPFVDVHLRNGQSHRVLAVLEVSDGYVVLEAQQRRGDAGPGKARWQESQRPARAPHETERAVVTYEAIVQVVITPLPPSDAARIGFFQQ